MKSLALFPASTFPEFPHELRASSVDVMQMNVGKVCNQRCAHCHVDAGPDRKESMSDDVVEACLRVLERDRIATLDITGGAPELHPRFEEIVKRARAIGARVIDRCNLTILTVPRYAHLARFFAEHDVEVIASLPHFEAERTDAQRGDGVFDKSIAALRILNDVGYGTTRELTLVANPTGAFLPAPERAFEADFRARLPDVKFSRLAMLTNMPIARYLEWLDRSGNSARYMSKLASAFNAATLEGLMCRTMVSVGWDGRVWDCDFNQMLELAPTSSSGGALGASGASQTSGSRAVVDTIHTWTRQAWVARRIATASHCFGCTAGQGSSCGGALVG